MTTLTYSPDDSTAVNEALTNTHPTEDTIEARRARRMAALRKAAGMWANRQDIPADGLEYQREIMS